jgi:hypothetical protein
MNMKARQEQGNEDYDCRRTIVGSVAQYKLQLGAPKLTPSKFWVTSESLKVSHSHFATRMCRTYSEYVIYDVKCFASTLQSKIV